MKGQPAPDGLAYLMLVLRERGLSVHVRADGTPALRGPAGQVTDALREALAAYRAEIVAAFPRQEEAAPKGAGARRREFRWPGGMVQGEGEGHLEEDAGLFPGLAVAWRYVGEETWKAIPPRSEA